MYHIEVLVGYGSNFLVHLVLEVRATVGALKKYQHYRPTFCHTSIIMDLKHTSTNSVGSYFGLGIPYDMICGLSLSASFTR